MRARPARSLRELIHSPYTSVIWTRIFQIVSYGIHMSSTTQPFLRPGCVAGACAWLNACRQAAPGHQPRDPLHRTPRAFGHQRRRQVAVIVVEHLEAVVAPVADAVDAAHQFAQLIAVDALAGEDAVVPRRVDAVLGRAHLAPQEIG